MESITMKQLIFEELHPIMENLFWKVADEGKNLTMQGIPVYNKDAQFVGGKVINMSCYVALELLKNSKDRENDLKKLGEIIRMVSDLPMETWGILNGITGLYRLKTAGLLELLVDQETIDHLKITLDWRTFVDCGNHYALIDKPTNYYGVAFGIARYRELLGWEEEKHSQILLDRLMEHIDTYSGILCYMDETAGDGRFDRYSVLIPSEITSLTLATGKETPSKIKKMLDRSAHIFLKLANEDGLGFSYGRSIGAYGDTAALEVLSAAAELGGIFTEEEEDLAYGYSMKVLEDMVRFWFDKEMQSMNMWEKGRRTDQYRNKNRILGENLSLCMQMINSMEHWCRAGWGEKKISPNFNEMLKKIQAFTLIRFANEGYERALAIVRDGKHVWSLPFINGGSKYYNHDAYLPIPHEGKVLEGVPDASYGNLVPQLLTAEGERLMPISYIKKIETKQDIDSFQIVCYQDQLCKLGGKKPEPIYGISATTTYIFQSGQIKRKDCFCVDNACSVKEIQLLFLTYSEKASIDKNQICFLEGVISCIETDGYEQCDVEKIEEVRSYDTPHGRLCTRVQYRKILTPKEKIEVEWIIRYHLH